MKTGFTLIELLVAVGMVLLVTTGALMLVNNFGARNSVSLASKDIARVLQSARSIAISRQLPGGVLGNPVFVRVSLAGGVMTVSAGEGGSNYKSYSLDYPMVEIVPSEANWKVDFEGITGKSVIGSGTITSPRSTDVGVTVRLAGDPDNSPKSVVVRPSGLIEIL